MVVSISSALVIPLSFIADYFLHGNKIPAVSMYGSVIVVFGLFVLNTVDLLDKLYMLCNRCGRKSDNGSGDKVAFANATDVRSDDFEMKDTTNI